MRELVLIEYLTTGMHFKALTSIDAGMHQKPDLFEKKRYQTAKRMAICS